MNHKFHWESDDDFAKRQAQEAMKEAQERFWQKVEAVVTLGFGIFVSVVVCLVCSFLILALSYGCVFMFRELVRFV